MIAVNCDIATSFEYGIVFLRVGGVAVGRVGNYSPGVKDRLLRDVYDVVRDMVECDSSGRIVMSSVREARSFIWRLHSLLTAFTSGLYVDELNDHLTLHADLSGVSVTAFDSRHGRGGRRAVNVALYFSPEIYADAVDVFFLVAPARHVRAVRAVRHIISLIGVMSEVSRDG